MAVIFKISPLFKETLTTLATQNPRLIDRIEAFKNFKNQNPLASFGSNDKSSKGIFLKAVPGIKHAHLTRDISIWYTVSGRDPIEIRLYGLFTHKDTGTGEPQNKKRQLSAAEWLKNQPF
jgi:hypothetical protein